MTCVLMKGNLNADALLCEDCSYAGTSWGPNSQKLGETPPLHLQRGRGPAHTLILNLWPTELGSKHFPLVKLLTVRLCYGCPSQLIQGIKMGHAKDCCDFRWVEWVTSELNRPAEGRNNDAEIQKADRGLWTLCRRVSTCLCVLVYVLIYSSCPPTDIWASTTHQALFYTVPHGAQHKSTTKIPAGLCYSAHSRTHTCTCPSVQLSLHLKYWGNSM